MKQSLILSIFANDDKSLIKIFLNKFDKTFKKGVREMAKVKYQIIATVEGFYFENGDTIKLTLKGVDKYRFDKDKKYWNIFERVNVKENTNIVDFIEPKIEDGAVRISTLKNKTGMWHLLDHAFTEKKKLMFEVDKEEEILNDETITTYTLIGVSHVSN